MSKDTLKQLFNYIYVLVLLSGNGLPGVDNKNWRIHYPLPPQKKLTCAHPRAYLE